MTTLLAFGTASQWALGLAVAALVGVALLFVAIDVLAEREDERWRKYAKDRETLVDLIDNVEGGLRTAEDRAERKVVR